MCRAALPIDNNRNTPPLCQPAALHPSRCIIFCTSLYDVFQLAKSLSVYQYQHSKHIPLRKTSPSVKPLHMTDMKSGQKERGLVGWTDGRYLPLCLRPLLLTTGATRSVVRGLPCSPLLSDARGGDTAATQTAGEARQEKPPADGEPVLRHLLWVRRA